MSHTSTFDIALELSLTESAILFFFFSLWSEEYNALWNWVSFRSFPLNIGMGLGLMIQILVLLSSHKSLQLIFCVCVCVSNSFMFFRVDNFCCLSSRSLAYFSVIICLLLIAFSELARERTWSQSLIEIFTQKLYIYIFFFSLATPGNSSQRM